GGHVRDGRLQQPRSSAMTDDQPATSVTPPTPADAGGAPFPGAPPPDPAATSAGSQAAPAGGGEGFSDPDQEPLGTADASVGHAYFRGDRSYDRGNTAYAYKSRIGNFVAGNFY